MRREEVVDGDETEEAGVESARKASQPDKLTVTHSDESTVVYGSGRDCTSASRSAQEEGREGQIRHSKVQMLNRPMSCIVASFEIDSSCCA